MIRVRRAGEADLEIWGAMRARLWPEEDAAELAAELPGLAALDPPYFGLVAERDGAVIGFAEIGVRTPAEGCAWRPAPFLEGIWVEPEFRRQGVARDLLAAAQQWARAEGFADFGSNADIANSASLAWHEAMGFAETSRLVSFVKKLDQKPSV